MTANSVSFLSAVLTTSSSYFYDESPKETFIRCIKNASEVFFSTPFSLFYVHQHWQFAIAPKEDFPYVTHATFWVLFSTIFFNQGPAKSILFLTICVIPKIYSRYTMLNYSKIELENFQTPLEKARKDLEGNNLKDDQMRHMALFFLEREQPEIAEKALSKDWTDKKKKDETRFALISYYLRIGNPTAAEKIMLSVDPYNVADFIALFKYCLKNAPEQAYNLMNNNVCESSCLRDYCLIHLAAFFLNHASATKDEAQIQIYGRAVKEAIDTVKTRNDLDKEHRKIAIDALNYLIQNDIEKALACIEKADFAAKHPLN